MKRILAPIALVVFALALSIGALAGSTKESFTLYHDSQLNGAQLPAGDYTIVYNTDGTSAQVKFLKGKKEVATATGQLKPLDKKPAYNQIRTTNGAISELEFHNSKTGITFEPSVANAGK